MAYATIARYYERRLLMQRAHKIRLNPTPEQESYLKQACGIARFTYNYGLRQYKSALNDHRLPQSVTDINTAFNAIKGEHFPWVYEVTKCAAETGFRNLQTALTNFWKSKKGQRKGKRMGFPRYKSKKRGYGSFTLDNARFSVDAHWLRIQKLDTPINMTETVRFTGAIGSATISYKAGWWWISILVDIPHEPPTHLGHPIGVDVGVKELAVDSDGQRYENQAPLRKAIGKVKRLQRCVSRRVKGSARRRKAVRKLARAHYRVASVRNDRAHKLTTELTRKGSVIGIETLNVSGMLSNHKLALSLSDASLSEIHRQLRYKAEWYGAEVVAVGRFYPSTQIHHGCGEKNASES